MIMVLERLTPAKQCTNTLPPDYITSSIQRFVSSKNREIFSLGKSISLKALYLNLFTKGQGSPKAAQIM